MTLPFFSQGQQIAQLEATLHVLRCQIKEEPSASTKGDDVVDSERLKLKERIQQLEKENTFLKEELDGLSPEFFDDIEDLKDDYCQLLQHVQQHEPQS